MAGALCAVLAAGCAPSRSEYYTGLRGSRVSAYRRWERHDRKDEERPAVEGELDLEAAVRLCLRHNRELQAVGQEREEARGRIVEAYSEALPSVDLSASYGRLDQVFSVDLGVQSFQVGDRDNYEYQVRVSQPIYKGGAIATAWRAARLFSYLSDENVRAKVEGVIFEVANAYYDAVLAAHLIQVQEAALRAAQAHLHNVESRRRHGVATEYDALRARVDVSNFQAALIEQRNQRDLARSRLFRALGVSRQSKVELSTDLSYLEVAPTFSEAVRTAFCNRPDLYQATLNVDLQRESLREAHARYLPSLDAYYWHRWAKPDPHESSNIEWDRQWQAGLDLSWGLFDGLAREGRIIQQRALLRKQQILLSDTEEQALLEISNALFEIQNARELVDSQRLNLERADRALELVQAGYREGVNTEVEVLDATAALTQARGLYYTALHRHTVARIDLQRAMGILGPRPGTRQGRQELARPGHVPIPAKGTPKEAQPNNPVRGSSP